MQNGITCPFLSDAHQDLSYLSLVLGLFDSFSNVLLPVLQPPIHHTVAFHASLTKTPWLCPLSVCLLQEAAKM